MVERIVSHHLIVRDDAAHAAALALAQGSYQHDLLAGSHALSGADLAGRAARYAGRYAASRGAIIARVRRAGIAIGERIGPHGKRILVLG